MTSSQPELLMKFNSYLGAGLLFFLVLHARAADLSSKYYGQPVPDLKAATSAGDINSPEYDLFQGVHDQYEKQAPALYQDEGWGNEPTFDSDRLNMTQEELDAAMRDGMPPPSYYEGQPQQPDSEPTPPDLPSELPPFIETPDDGSGNGQEGGEEEDGWE